MSSVNIKDQTKHGLPLKKVTVKHMIVIGGSRRIELGSITISGVEISSYLGKLTASGFAYGMGMVFL